jgi:hypothetical protein
MKSSITPSTIANQVRMLNCQKNNCFCIVEGPDDKKFFKRFLETACDLVIAYGRENAEKALAILEKEGHIKVLAIVDADFDFLENRPASSENVLRTDTHDIEILCLSTVAFSKLLIEFGSEGKLAFNKTPDELRNSLMHAASAIGYLRWFSIRQNLALNFEDLKFGRFVDDNSISIQKENLFAEIRNHSHRPDLPDSFFVQGIDALQDFKHDLKLLCCGHDVIEILSICFRKQLGSNNAQEVKPEVLTRSLRLAYEQADFEKTNLWISFCNWQNAHAYSDISNKLNNKLKSK